MWTRNLKLIEYGDLFNGSQTKKYVANTQNQLSLIIKIVESCHVPDHRTVSQFH